MEQPPPTSAQIRRTRGRTPSIPRGMGTGTTKAAASTPSDHRFDQYLDGGILYLGFMDLTVHDFKRIVAHLSPSRACELDSIEASRVVDAPCSCRGGCDRGAEGRNALSSTSASASPDGGRPSKRTRTGNARSSTRKCCTMNTRMNMDTPTEGANRSARQGARGRPTINGSGRRYNLEEILAKVKDKQRKQAESDAARPSQAAASAFIPLWKLNIVGNRLIGDEGMEYLHLLPPTITDLDLSDCALTPAGIQRVCQYLQQPQMPSSATSSATASTSAGMKGRASRPSVTRCIMWGNQIGDEGANHIAEMISSNTALRELCIMQGSIGPFGYLNISKSLMFNTNLKELTIYHRKLTELHVWAMQCFLEHNRSLETLDMWSAPPLSAGLVDKLVRIARSNPNFKRIKLGYEYPELSYWLALNRCGRAKTMREDATEADWMRCVLKSSTMSLSNNLDSIYHFIRNKPELCDTEKGVLMKDSAGPLASSSVGSFISSVRGESTSSTKRYLIQTYRALIAPVVQPPTRSSSSLTLSSSTKAARKTTAAAAAPRPTAMPACASRVVTNARSVLMFDGENGNHESSGKISDVDEDTDGEESRGGTEARRDDADDALFQEGSNPSLQSVPSTSSTSKKNASSIESIGNARVVGSKRTHDDMEGIVVLHSIA
eukprot:CAMPEP_0119568820 /NCGR_PEP_ID=MMETSP1352-20130426/39892_1 /TAXON_ID=265584 /ORGANISM="Stauroneis constricta, Strain CCMP1120" /LENGTH=662 /DNA_ID=CAMNT_0007618277 /DNA_START=153 /DNA_END=2141 /DNA_ORIENTATION=+